jgi:hypothetical protein
MPQSLHDAHVVCWHNMWHEFDAAWAIYEKIDQCKAGIERWERLEQNAPTPSEAIAAEQRLVALRQELANLNRQMTGAEVVAPAAEQTPPPEPAQAQAQAQAAPASGKVWTEARKAEVQQYRDRHGLKKTADHYKVSQATISKHTTPKKKPTASPFAGLGSRPR